jgi:type IV secretory pathway VirB4 component
VNVEVTIPDQTKILEHFKGRLRKMQAAQRDSHGAFRVNIEAQVAQNQLQEVLQAVISSSLKVCNYSMVIAVRTSKPAISRTDLDEAQRILNDRRQRVVHAVTRMNGARAIPESLAQRRLFIGSLPGMAQENKREQSCLTLHAADLLPIETPWHGMPQSPLMLLETPYRQLIPFSPYDPSLGDANMLFMAKSGSGKTFMAQMFLLMMARANPLISIVERGDSYRPLVELMGGRVIEVDLEGSETLNPWDLPPGEIQPTKDKIAFLKNLTRHMIGDLGQSDTSLLDNILSEAIAKVYKRTAVRADVKTPTYLDLRNELSTWTDEERIQHIRGLAQLAAVALRQWTGEKGVYSKLFDRHTTIRTDANWLFFDIEGLSSDPRLETAMSMLIAQAMSERASGKSGEPSITVLDECWSLLESPVLADCVVQLFRTARKRGASVWGISQTLEDFVGNKQKPKEHGAGILRNASVKVIGQQPGDVSPLIDHLGLNEVALNEIKRFSSPRMGRSAEALLVLGEKSETTQTIRLVPTPLEYWIATTYPRERAYRTYFMRLDRNRKRPLIENYLDLAERFPHGLADSEILPEEASGAVQEASAKRRKIDYSAMRV